MSLILPMKPRTLRLAAVSFDRLREQKSNLTAQERTELIALAIALRSVARGEGDATVTAFPTDVMGERLEAEVRDIRGDHDSPLSRRNR